MIIIENIDETQYEENMKVFLIPPLMITNDVNIWMHFPPVFFGTYMVLVVEKLPASAGDVRDTGLIPGLGRSPGGGHGNALHYSCLENPMDRGAWWAIVHRVAKSWTWLKWLSTHAHIVSRHLQTDSFTLSFPVWSHMSFPHLIAVARTYYAK